MAAELVLWFLDGQDKVCTHHGYLNPSVFLDILPWHQKDLSVSMVLLNLAKLNYWAQRKLTKQSNKSYQNVQEYAAQTTLPEEREKNPKT